MEDNKEKQLDEIEQQKQYLMQYARSMGNLISNNLITAQKKNLFANKFGLDTVMTYLSNPQKYESKLRQMSTVLMTLSPLYASIVNYFGSISKFVPVVIPDVTKFQKGAKNNEIDYDKLNKEYLKVSRYIEYLSIPSEFTRILNQMCVNDVFYGYQINKGDSNYFLQLDEDFCRISSITDGCYNFQFDFSYFDKNNELKDVDDTLLESYPVEFATKYKKYKNDKTQRWQELEEKNTICIKYTDLPFVFPPYASLYYDLSDIQDYKDNAKAKDSNSAYKLLGMQIPLNDKVEKTDAMKVSIQTALQFYEMINSSLPEGIGAFITPMPFQKIDFNTNEASEKNKILDAEQSLFTATGFSPINFGRAEGSTGLASSNLVDSGKLFTIYRKFERWLNRKMKLEFGGRFTIDLLDVTIFTVDEEISKLQSLAQFGVPVKMKLSALSGVTSLKERGMVALEEMLDLANTWKPLNSSFIGNTTDDEGGRPKKSDGEIADNTEISRDRDTDV